MSQDIEKRINRAIGQLESLKKELLSESYECEDVLIQIKAVVGSVKSLAKFVAEEDLDKCMSGSLSREEQKKRLKSVLDTAFK